MTGPLTADQIFINNLAEIILANLKNENFGVNELAKMSGISLYRLGRRLNRINGKTVTQFVRETQLHKAMDFLQNTEYSGKRTCNCFHN
jgi:AraC-like DNA-binding protein